MNEKAILKLKELDKLYYEGNPGTSDENYDRGKDALKEAFPDHPYFQTLGAPVKGGKVKLPYVLGSLNKVKPETVEKWLSKHDGEYIISEKLDGVSIYVEYTDGEVTFSSTRGDGYIGKDITDKAKIFCPSIPGMSGEYSFRAEAMLIEGVHEKLGFKTARNGVAGILNRDEKTYEEYIVPFFYEVIDSPDVFENQLLVMKFLMKYFKVPMYRHANSESSKELSCFLGFCKHNSKGKYEIDGLVITPLNYIRENVSYPEHKVAYKEQGKGVEAEVLGVEWSVTRTGRIMPVVNLKPFEYDGVTISRATGFNADFIQDNNIQEGTFVEVVRGGDVIPHILGVTKNNDTKMDLPTVCPSCGQDVKKVGVDVVCSNPTCDEKAYYQVEHFIRTLGCENITYKTLMKLGINKIEDLYSIDEFEIADMDGFGVKKASMIVDEIQSTLLTTPDKLLDSFGIPNVGTTVSKLITDKYVDNDFNELFYLTRDELIAIKGVGDVIAESFCDGIGRFKVLFEYLIMQGLTFKQVDGPLNGKIVTLTGKGPYSRPALENMIADAGGTIKSASKKTDILVAADINSNTGKMKKARQYGTKIVSYEDLMVMING